MSMIGSRDITNERKRANIDRRIDRLKNADDQFFEFGIADDDLRVAGAADHSRIAALERNGFDALVHFLNVAARFFVLPIGQAVKPVGETAVGFGIADIVKSFESLAGLDQRRDAAGEAVAIPDSACEARP